MIKQISRHTVTSMRKVSDVEVSTYAKTLFKASNELDNHADTCCLGSNCVPIYFTGDECEVMPYSSDYEPIKHIPIVQGATAYDDDNTGETIILIYNQSLYFGDRLDHTLTNPNQLRAHGHSVCDDPYDPNRALGIQIQGTDIFIPFETRGTTVLFHTRVPTIQELKECRSVILTSESTWDPNEINLHRTTKVSAINISPCNPQEGDYQFGDAIRSVSSCYCLRSSLQALLNSVCVDPINDVNDRGMSSTHTYHARNSYIGAMITERGSTITAEQLAKRWNIGFESAKQTLNVTTQRGIRQAVHPMTRRYRTDLLQNKYKRLNQTWYTDTMFLTHKSIKNETCSQVFTNTSMIWAYPMRSKSQAGEALNAFKQDIGVPKRLIFDGSMEQCMPNTEFMKSIQRDHIEWRNIEPYSHWQNRAEDAIRELRRRVRRNRIKKNIPPRLWSYQQRYECEILAMTARLKDERSAYEMVTGDTPDISEYVDFSFYDPVWFWDQPKDDGNPYIGRWLGVSHRIGSAMCYFIINGNGAIESRTSVQPLSQDELMSEAIQIRIGELDDGIHKRLGNPNNFLTDDAQNLILQEDMSINDEYHVDDNVDAMIDEDELHYTPDINDPYIGVEILLPEGDQHTSATVLKRARGNDGLPIGRRHVNPILDTRLYEVEYSTGRIEQIQANLIAQNMFAQTDSEGHRFLLMKEIVDHHKGHDAMKQGDNIILSRNGNKTYRRTTKGWKFLVEWKDGTSSWVDLRELKDSFPIELAEYSIANKIQDEPAFIWWVQHTLRKRNRIISKIKSKYWKQTHKFGIEMPKSAKEALELDRKNGNDLWTKAIEKEMSKIKSMEAFERWDKGTAEGLRCGKSKLPGFKEITAHLVFDIKLDGKFTRKASFVANGSMTDTPAALTYSSVVSRESVRIALTYAALNELDILGCDVSNAYLEAPCREKFWLEAGPEFGEDEGTVMIIRRALYGLKSSGAAWRQMISEILIELNYENTLADPDVWRRPMSKPNGFKYYEFALVYVDDILIISHSPQGTMHVLGTRFDLKDTVKTPDRYLGANLRKWTLPDGRVCWSMSGKDYLKNAITTVKQLMKKDGIHWPGAKKSERPFPKQYKPEIDSTRLLDGDGLGRYQQLIGILRWAVELGRVDICLEVSLLSSFLCMPREGHLNAAYNVFAYLDKHLDANLVFDDIYPLIDTSVFKKTDWSETYYGPPGEEIPHNMPEPRGNPVVISCFVDANHAGDLVTRKSQTGIFIYINNALVIWFSKKQMTVESSTFGSEFVAARIAVEQIQALKYKLMMFGIPIDGITNMFCDNKSVVDSCSLPEARLAKKHNAICYHKVREAAAKGWVRVGKEDGDTNLSDLLTKPLSTEKRREILKCIFVKGG